MGLLSVQYALIVHLISSRLNDDLEWKQFYFTMVNLALEDLLLLKLI